MVYTGKRAILFGSTDGYEIFHKIWDCGGYVVDTALKYKQADVAFNGI